LVPRSLFLLGATEVPKIIELSGFSPNPTSVQTQG
jgi:hypothetical protein